MEENLIQVKFFKAGDEPNARALTKEEVEEIQKTLPSSNSPHGDDLKHKDAILEGKSMMRVIEKVK